MNFDYTDEQKQIRKEIIDFCRAELNEGIEERDRAGEFPRELFEKIGAGPRLQGLPVDTGLRRPRARPADDDRRAGGFRLRL